MGDLFKNENFGQKSKLWSKKSQILVKINLKFLVKKDLNFWSKNVKFWLKILKFSSKKFQILSKKSQILGKKISSFCQNYFFFQKCCCNTLVSIIIRLLIFQNRNGQKIKVGRLDPPPAILIFRTQFVTLIANLANC